jgi:hypothetical protein
LKPPRAGTGALVLILFSPTRRDTMTYKCKWW